MIWAVLAVAMLADAGADVERLGWLAGSWIEQKPGVTTRETWLAPLGGVMAGANQTNRDGRPAQVEHMIIAPGPGGATFTALVAGQPPVGFTLQPGSDGEAVFENKAHDFPQRVIYRRCGLDLCARIEGAVNGAPQALEWRFRRAP